MQTRRIGANGPEVSAIGIGAMSFGNFYGPTTEEASVAILDTAQDLGITHIDTANVYGDGHSESVIGRYLAANPGARDRFFIATKGAITRNADGSRALDNSAAHLTAALDASLERLGVEAVDLYYVHRRDVRVEVEEMAETLAGIIQSGKARAIGLSEIAPGTLRRAAAVCPIAAVQSEYSLSTRAPDLGLIQACADLGSALVAFSPVGRGLLTDAPPTADKVSGMPFLSSNPRFMGRNLAENLAATARFRALAADMGEPAAALAIAWLLARGDHVLPIPGTRSTRHLHELARGAEIVLTSEDLVRIEAVLPVGWAHGDRYNDTQWVGPERYC